MGVKKYYYLIIIIFLELTLINGFLVLVFVQKSGRPFVWGLTQTKSREDIEIREFTLSQYDTKTRFVKTSFENGLISVLEEILVKRKQTNRMISLTEYPQ